MSGNVNHGFAGSTILKKISGSGPVAANTEILIPHIETDLHDPRNNQYVPVVNKAIGPSNYVKGRGTPTDMIRTCAKSSWFTANNIRSLIIDRDSNFDTDLWAIQHYEEDTVKADGCRCVALSASGRFAGGPVAVELGFLVTNAQGATSFTGTGATDAGELFGAAQIDFGATPAADLVEEWSLMIAAPGAYDFFSSRQRNPDGVSSGQVGGTLTLIQSPKASTVAVSQVPIRFYIGDPGSQTLALTLTANVNLDDQVRRRNVGFGMMASTYSLINTSTGGVPISAT